MAILDNLAKAAKGFFVESDGEAPAADAPRRAGPPANPTPLPLPSLPPGATQSEQRHLDHIAQLLAGDNKDFGAFAKMVKSLAASGLSGPLLYQTAFNAFSAMTGTDLPTLLTSADALTQKLADDRAQVQARHREKMGEGGSPGKPGALAQLREQETRLQAAVASLTQQLTEKSQQLTETQQQLQQETTKTQAALASYELAHAAAVAELQAHQQATKSFLIK